MTGFLNDLPDLGMPKSKPRTAEAVTDTVLWRPVRCPRCKSKRAPVYCTTGSPIRYHKCDDCKFTFKSVEIE